MSLLHSAAAILAVIAAILTLISGVKDQSRVPLWIPVLLLCVALIVAVAPA